MTVQVDWRVIGWGGTVTVGDEQGMRSGLHVIGWVIRFGGAVMSGGVSGTGGSGAFGHLIVGASPYILDL